MRLLFLCFTVSLLFSRYAYSENWPQWRGANSDGISLEKNIPTTWSKSENVAWRTPMPGQAGATPCVWDNQIYVTSAEGSDLVLLCLSALDGKIRWKRTIGTGNQDARAGEGNSASPSPSTDGQHVWVFFGTGKLACFTKEGEEVWKLDVGERFGKLDIQFGMTSTPVLDGDALYMQLIHGRMNRQDQTRTGKVIKLDKLTGKTAWEMERVTDAQFECKHSYASPFMYDGKNAKFLVVHGADCTTGHELKTGQEIWRLGMLNGTTKLNAKPNDSTFRFVASPCVDPKSNTIIIPTAKEGPVIAVIATELSGDCSEKASVVKWNLPRTPDVSIPLVVDGLAYLLNKDGQLQCVELATGNEIYMNRTYTGQHRTSPTFADGHIYYGSNDGHVTVVKAGRDFKIVSTIDMGEAITASAIVSNGTLYIRSYEALYAIKYKK